LTGVKQYCRLPYEKLKSNATESGIDIDKWKAVA